MELQLQKLRKLAGYKKQGDMAEAVGVPHRRYESWERGEAMMSLEQAYLVTEVLGCTLDELCGRKVERSFGDPKQTALNGYYEAMNDRGKAEAVTFIKRMSADPEVRIVKDGPEPAAYKTAMGA